MKWFIVYMTINHCVSSLQIGCGGSYQAQMMMPSREICEQVVRDNPHAGLKCWAMPAEETK
jgi:hypothetical protein